MRDRGVAWYPRRMGCVGLEFKSRRSHLFWGILRPGTVSAARILVTYHGTPGLCATLGPEHVVLSAGAVLDSIRAAFRPG